MGCRIERPEAVPKRLVPQTVKAKQETLIDADYLRLILSIPFDWVLK
jgi:hypothetical protein